MPELSHIKAIPISTTLTIRELVVKLLDSSTTCTCIMDKYHQMIAIHPPIVLCNIPIK